MMYIARMESRMMSISMQRATFNTPFHQALRRIPKGALLTLIAVNIVIPMIGLWVFHWDAATLLFVYWGENIVVMFYALLRLAFSKHVDDVRVNDRRVPLSGTASKLFVLGFFTVHFGIFALVHLGFLVSIFATEPFSVYLHAILIGAPLLFVSHGVSFVQNFWFRERQTVPTYELMIKPYARIVPIHIAIILGGLFVASMDAPMAGIIILSIAKLIMDVKLHAKSHAVS